MFVDPYSQLPKIINQVIFFWAKSDLDKKKIFLNDLGIILGR